MIPGMGGRGGMNPKKVAAMMRQMGIEMEDIDGVEEVLIRTATREIQIKPAEVSKITQQGQSSWQVVGKATFRPRGPPAPTPAAEYVSTPSGPTFTEEDVALVAEQANVSKDEARKALQATDGQTAEAILKLLGE